MDFTVVPIIAIYISLLCKYSEFKVKLDKFVRDINMTSKMTIGDFNMKSITQLSHCWSEKVGKDIPEKYNLRQIVRDYTSYKSTLYLGFINTEVNHTLIWNHWSDHRMLCLQLNK